MQNDLLRFLFFILLFIKVLLPVQPKSVVTDTFPDSIPTKKDTARIKTTGKTYRLKELTVTARKQEVAQKGDTAIVDATAFKTPEGAYLEELVKRIPGLDYDRKTKQMTYQGKPITGINLNGELFFGGDTKQALENLTADVVSKIKIYDKRTELEKITGVDDGQENYILDLQTKSSYNGSILLAGQGGHGNHNKKDYNLNGNYFKANGENVSLMGRSSNRNITTDYPDNISNNMGLNFVKKSGRKLTLNGSVFYNRYKSGNETALYNEQYLTSGNMYQISAGNSISGSRSLNASLGLRYEIDKRTFLNVQGSFNLNKNNNSSDSRNATFDGRPDVDYAAPFARYETTPDSIRLNSATMTSTSSSRTTGYSFNADFTRRLNGRGTSLSLTARFSGNDGRNESLSNSSTTYYRLQDAAGNDSILIRNQRQYSPTRSWNASVGLMFTQPLSKKLRLQLSYNLQYNKESNDRETYAPVEFVDSLSNRSRSNSLMHRVGLLNDGSTTLPQRSLTKDDRLNARLKAAWLPSWGNFELSGDWSFNHSKNDLQNSNIYTRNYDFGLDAFADLPGGLQLKTDADYTFRNGTNITPGEDDQFVWNAGFSWRFLKKKQAELSFYWADILSKRKSYRRATTATGFYEQHSRQIGSYFLVSFKYRLNITLKK